MRKHVIQSHAEEFLKTYDQKMQSMPATDYRPSQEYVSKVMDSISQHYDSYQRKKGFESSCIKIVSVLLILSISSCLIWFTPSARATLLSWFKVENENSVTFRYQIDNETELPAYRPGWLPDGVELVGSSEDFDSCILVYSNGNGGLILTYNNFSSSNEQAIVSSDLSGKEEFQLNGCFAIFVPNSEQAGGDLMWIDEQNEISFCINSTYSKEIMLKCAKSITMVSE